MVLIKVGIIFVARAIDGRMEILPLSVHVIYLLIGSRLCSTLSIRMIPMVKVTSQD